MKCAMLLVTIIVTSLGSLVPARAQQDRMNTICSFWMKGELLGENKCMVAWGASRVMAITYLAGETPQSGVKETIRPNRDGWVYGRDAECLLLPSTGYAICQKSPVHRIKKDYLSQ